MLIVDIPVAQDDIADSVIYALFGLVTELFQCIAQPALTLGYGEQNGQFGGVEALVAYVAQDVELRVVEHGMRQTHHLAVRLIGCQYA